VRRQALLAAAVIGLGCTSSAPRPISPAAEEILASTVAETHAAAVRAVSGLGLPIRVAEVADGVVETDYVDIASFRPEAAQYPMAERLVRFRVAVIAHESNPATRMTVYAIYSPFRTGLTNVRRGERAVPPDHPAMSLVRRMVTEVRTSVERG